MAGLADLVRGRIAGLAGGFAIGEVASLMAERGNFVYGDQNLRFPLDIKDHCIHLEFSKYERRSIYQQPFFRPTSAIRLPIPGRLVDNVSVDYNTESLGPMLGAAAEAVTSAGDIASTSSGEGLVSRLTRGIDAITGTPVGAGAALAEQLPTQVLGALSSVTGVAINPFQTVLFKSPNFKKHNFSWRLVPRSPDESRVLEQIIRMFKYHMLPGIGTSGVFFTFPEILKIALYPTDSYLYKFKPCVVESVSVNYAPNGPSFYRDTNAPTAVEFNIELQEIEIWTKADYMRSDNGTIQRGLFTSEVRGRAPSNLTEI